MEELNEICLELFEIGCVKFGKFTLKSGLKSPIYIDLRLLISKPDLLKKTAIAILKKANDLEFDRIAGIPLAAVPIATAMSLESKIPMVFPRKQVKEYGTKKAVEGEFKKGETALLVDDLITSGESKMEAIKPLVEAGLKVKDICVLIDRQQGGKEFLEKNNFHLHAVLSVTELINILKDNKKITDSQFEQSLKYIQGDKNSI